MRLSNYNNKVEPFQDYVVEGTLFHATYIPFTLSWIYSLFTFQVMDSNLFGVVLLTLLILYRFITYKIKLKYYLIILLGAYVPLIFIYWFPLLYYLRNGKSKIIIEIIIDFMFIMAIPTLIWRL